MFFRIGGKQITTCSSVYRIHRIIRRISVHFRSRMRIAATESKSRLHDPNGTRCFDDQKTRISWA